MTGGVFFFGFLAMKEKKGQLAGDCGKFWERASVSDFDPFQANQSRLPPPFHPFQPFFPLFFSVDFPSQFPDWIPLPTAALSAET